MASSNIEVSENKLPGCPVCIKPFKDPRLLTCGHRFCEKCLVDIVLHQPGEDKYDVTCPVCCDVTALEHGDVTELPRSRHTGEDIKKSQDIKCSRCKEETPTKHCPECTHEFTYLCDRCFEGHQKFSRFASHNVVAFMPALVCLRHIHKMVEVYCQDCSETLCVECVFEKHLEHRTEPLKDTAEKSKEVVTNFLKSQGNRKAAMSLHKYMEEKSKTLEEERTNFNNEVVILN